MHIFRRKQTRDTGDIYRAASVRTICFGSEQKSDSRARDARRPRQRRSAASDAATSASTRRGGSVYAA